MKTNTVILTALLGVLSVGCSKENDSPILLIGDIESEKISLKNHSIEETIKPSEFN